ncbi:very-short-patch-repair endonuclease [Mariniflexile fucanivorans]|uniref:Very-short-patch-repair endonuclease n=1 Tax=Mariniflexile fucanivorans TaxID=264023 RepID=A0A4V2QEC4_9FLAO|nr:endonuclease domain-containing protein [Mariniflexile fucanivorans]TCL67507.1 very-short-patch-repair endonuclease [Mariniflexile fucanivorans]
MPPQILTYIHETPIYKQNMAILPRQKELLIRAQALRKAGVLSEVIFWKEVRHDTFWNIDFDRQRVIGHYIVDFYIKTLGLIIEIDGSSHENKQEYDAKRELFLMQLGLKVYRISDYRVKHDLGNVMKELEAYVISQFGPRSF